MRELAERRQIARLFAGVLLLGAAAAFVSCGSADTEADADSGSSSGSSSSVALTWDARSLQESESDAPFSTSILPTSVAVGPSRMLFALIDRAQGTLVSGATITARYYRLAADPEKEPDVSEEYATTDVISRTLDLRGVAGDSTSPVNDADLTTVYSTTATFDAPGYWGVSLEITVGDETYRPRMKFWVLEATPEIAVGAPAPRSEQATLADVADAVAVSSQPEPNEAMLDQTVAAALDSGKPVVVAFVTPAFCVTRFCGPVLDAVVQPAFEQYGDRVEFVHIEPYDLAKARTESVLEPVPAVLEWGIQTEPFIFVIDAEGIVRAKLEGVTDLAELSDAIESVLPGA